MTALLLNPRILGAVGGLIALAAAYLWVDHRGYVRGVETTTSTWMKREAVELAAANAEILRLQAEARKKEHDAAEAIAALAVQHDKEMRHVRATHDAFLDDLAAGRVRFYVPATSPTSGSGAGAAITPTPSGGDGEARADLPEAVTRFLYAEAALADEIVGQLTLAQGVIEEYRLACR